MAFGAVTILMDTLHQHFLQPRPRFALRDKRKVTSLYRNLSSLQTSLEEYVQVGEYDEAIKGLEAQLRDVSVELRFQTEHHLRLFYLGKAMKIRLHSAQKLLPILNQAIKDIKTMDFGSILDILPKHFMLPVSRMPAHIKKMVKSFYWRHEFLFDKRYIYYGQKRARMRKRTRVNKKVGMNVQESKNELETDVEQESEDEQESDDERESKDKERRYMLYEAESLIRQELRASYLNKYMKQRIQARRRIRQLFMLGIKLTSYIKKEMLKVKNEYDHSRNSQNNNIASLRGLEQDNISVGDSWQHTSESAIKMVGCDDEFNTIMDKLNQQSSKRKIVSIVGMGGIGKTTLARRIYGDASFISRFDCRAWVTITQEYNPRQVFQGLLHSLGQRVCENNEASNNKLAEQVYRCLKHQRYLIVVDDIWNTDVWDDLMRCFQDDNNGSRILLTTRLKSVAVYACPGSLFCHSMRFLDSDESWDLFHSKVCKRTILSPEFGTIAREIAEKCKGLPLAITVMAGLLSNSKQTFNEWERVAKNVHTLSLDHSNQQCENIIHLSYTFLPHHLKLCFLSFGCFPEDYEVHEGMIVDFWISEGFLKVSGSKSLEDVAMESLQDLVDRNLVLICGERDYGLSKVYQMHDVLRELALREAKKENMLYFKENNVIGMRCRRTQPWSIQSRICSSNTSSFIHLYGYHYSGRVHTHSKFLRALVLDEFIEVNKIFGEVMGLVHLRWLKVLCHLNLSSLPLFMLWNLQKLEIEVLSLREPLYIWGLPQLRNLYIREPITLDPPRSVYHNLETIKFLNYRSCTKELFMRIPNLRELGVTSTYHDNPKSSHWFESLAYLYKLEELEVRFKFPDWDFKTIHSRGMLSLENFLPNLKKLQLFFTELKWKDMDVVGMLPKLEELRLYDGAVVGQKWEPTDGGFHRLKFLGIFYCHLQSWEATSSNFPVLECLVLKCPNLKEIPCGFSDIPTLKSIKLGKCFDSLILSAKRIHEEQQEYGNYAFVVDISSN